jgi:hypothetical protein
MQTVNRSFAASYDPFFCKNWKYFSIQCPLSFCKKLKVLFYPRPPDFLNGFAFWKVLRLRLFVLLVRTTFT